MHGLIFVTWEKYLSERFGDNLLYAYRDAIGETFATAPLTSRLYDDATLLAGVGAACTLTGVDADILLREYGRYFILNGLTSHLCTYVLSHVSSGRELLLTMRDVHARLRQTNDGLTPPLFNYEATDQSNRVVLLYDSPRQVCSVLWGAIEGAAALYNERVQVIEHSCMKRGASVCRFEARFFSSQEQQPYVKTPEQRSRQQVREHLTKVVQTCLPEKGKGAGFTLVELQQALRRQRNVPTSYLRPAVLLETLQHLQFSGLVASTASQQPDLMQRQYWKVITYWE